MIKWITELFKNKNINYDLSQHRLHTTKYEDLCM